MVTKLTFRISVNGSAHMSSCHEQIPNSNSNKYTHVTFTFFHLYMQCNGWKMENSVVFLSLHFTLCVQCTNKMRAKYGNIDCSQCAYTLKLHTYTLGRDMRVCIRKSIRVNQVRLNSLWLSTGNCGWMAITRVAPYGHGSSGYADRIG